MKSAVSFFSMVILVATPLFSGHADVIAGPVTNPATGHDYYLLSPDTWTTSEGEAEMLGGTLAIIRNASEQKWVFSKFGSYGGADRNLWIGLHRQYPGGPFAWQMPGVKFDYSYWCASQPDNGSGGTEDCVHMRPPNLSVGQLLHGGWNDLADNGSCDGMAPCGVVEIPGKSNEEKLTDQEKSLVGIWYESGDDNHAAWITATDNLLFLIAHNRRASRLVLTPEGLVFDAHRVIGKVAGDNILWSNGTWWSRKPLVQKN